MKVKIIAGVGALVLVLALLFTLKPESFEKTFDKTISDMDSYVLEGDMELTKGEEIKQYSVIVGYQKNEDSDFFKVSLYDKTLAQEQVILRNSDGVFVVTPSLNQVFKFEGEWPMNSPKPYLLQSMAEIVQSENAEVEKENDGYVVSSEVNYPNNQTYKYQVMKFNKEAKVEWIEIFNEDNITQLKIVFRNVEYNKEMEDKYFDAPTTLEDTVSAPVLTSEDLPLYPSSVYNSKLTSSTTMNVNGQDRHVLQFQGDKSFTVIQVVKEKVDKTQTVIMPGKIVDSLDIIGFYDGNRMSAIYNNIEYTIYSDDLGPEEMMSIITSMRIAVMK